MIPALLLGAGIGMLVAAQVGPVWLLCARSAARYGFVTGAMIGLGAAGVDLAYASLAALGVGTTVTQPSLRATLGLLGAAVLAWYAARTLRSAWRIHHGEVLSEDAVAPATALRTGVIATASNPLTIISWAAIFGGATTLATVGSPIQAVALIAGIAAGSLAWHLGLSVLFGALGRRIGAGPLVAIDVVSGLGLAAFAAVLAAGAGTALASL